MKKPITFKLIRNNNFGAQLKILFFTANFEVFLRKFRNTKNSRNDCFFQALLQASLNFEAENFNFEIKWQIVNIL